MIVPIMPVAESRPRARIATRGLTSNTKGASIMRRRAPGVRIRIATMVLVILGGSLPMMGIVGAAQEEDPAATVVATNLANPRGFTWDDDGQLLVALAGTGGDEPARGQIQPPPNGPWTGGITAELVHVDDNCVATPVIEGLPSAVDATGAVIGAADVARLDGTTYVLVAGGGEGHGNQGVANGIYAVTAGGEADLVVDLSAWFAAYSVENLPEADFDPEGNFYNLIAGDDGRLWVSESNSEQILAVTTSGEVERVADLSAENMVPTGLAPAPDGGVYVGYLSSAPFTDGSAKVIEVTPEGDVSDVWTGLTAVTSIAVDADGNLYAAEMSTGNTAEPPFLRPNSGRIVRQSGPDSSEVIATGLPFPVSLDVGPDDGLYVSFPGLGGETTGGVIRIQPGDDAIDLAAAGVLLAICGDVRLGSDATEEAEPATEEVSNDGTEQTEEPADNSGFVDPLPEQVAGVPDEFGNVRIDIVDFAFDPPMVEVPVGARVTWVNVGPTDHTAVAFGTDGSKVFDSNIMHEGDVYSLSLTRPGRYEYICGLHPSMMAVVIVTE
jgi:plastocyanin